ncbi:hypothetical protein D6K01_16385 [Salmonella enterica subsp. enterica serovar Oslo]|nr:hypothetical protein [Salmonella enterica subsp. enterica serovar Oslo]
MRVGSMLNVYVICNNALVHKQYVIANSTERVQWFLLTTGLKIALTRYSFNLLTVCQARRDKRVVVIIICS